MLRRAIGRWLVAESTGNIVAHGGEGPRVDDQRLIGDIQKYVEYCYDMKCQQFQQLVSSKPLDEQVLYLLAEADTSNFARKGQALATRYSCLDESGERALRLHLNLGRAARHAGVGGDRPVQLPSTATCEAAGCNICPTTMAVKSGYTQMFLVHEVNTKNVRVMANPFPLAEGHLTVASMKHEPQSWGPRGADATHQRIERTVLDVYLVANELPESLVMFNGEDAGATIPHHYHLHVMRHRQEDLYPLQIAALEAARSHTMRLIIDPSSGSIIEYVDNGKIYPLAFARAVGLAGARALAEMLKRWVDLVPSATANLIAIREQGDVAMYLVPRDRRFNRAPGMEGVPGGLEMLGEIVLTTPEQVDRIARNEYSYEVLWRMLRSVRPIDLALLVTE
jgi:diadenosine tetraphosphate (Ap4A) HIT family hydrolase